MIKGNGVSTGVGFGNVVVLKNNERKIEKKIRHFLNMIIS